jgi:hypothetical protein
MRSTIAIVAPTKLLESASAHFSFAVINNRIACDASAKDGVNWLPKPIIESMPFSEWWVHGHVKAKRGPSPCERTIGRTSSGAADSSKCHHRMESDEERTVESRLRSREGGVGHEV